MNGRTIVTSAWLMVLTVLAVGLSAWFFVHSSVFAAAIQMEIDRESRPGVISIGRIEWGPHPYEVTAFDVIMRDRSSNVILRASRARARIDLDLFHAARRQLQLVVEHIRIDDFDLTLEWNDDGKLTLADTYAGRAVGIGVEKQPEKMLLLDLRDIELSGGRLHLVWPKFGFSFEAIETAGKVRATIEDLDITVPALDCVEGTAWIRSAPGWLHEALTTHLPLNDMARSAPEGTRIPFAKVRIRDFTWAGDGFTTDLRLVASSEMPIHARGSMDFPKDEGIVHDLKLDATLRGALVEALTQKQVGGDTVLRLATRGRDLASKVTLGPMKVEAVRVPGAKLTAVELDRIGIDATGERASVNFALGTKTLELANSQLEDVRIEGEAGLGYPGFTLLELIMRLSPPPTSTLGWLKVFPPAKTKALAAVRTLEASSMRLGKATITRPAVRGLELQVEPGALTPELTARLERATSDSTGRISATARAVVSLFPPSVVFEATVTLEKVDSGKIRQIIGDHEALAGRPGPVSGELVVVIDPRSGDMETRKLTLEPPL